MNSQTLAYEFLSECHPHVCLEVLIHLLKLCTFFSQFWFYITRTKNVFKVNPVLLHNQPIVNYQSCIENYLLKFLRLASLSFQVSVTQNRWKIRQKLIQLWVQILNLIQHERVLVPWIFRLVFLDVKFQFCPSVSVLLDLSLQNLFLFDQRWNLDNLILVSVELFFNQIFQSEVFINHKLSFYDCLYDLPVFSIFLKFFVT